MITGLIGGVVNAVRSNRSGERYGRRLKNCGSGVGARVCYGWSHVPGFNEPIHGGLVKAQSMQERFPHSFPEANLLYLISSALPPGIDRIVSHAKRRGIRVVLNQNGVAYPSWHGPGWEKTNERLARVLHAADAVIFQSRFCKLAADTFLGEVRGLQETLYNPVELNRFSPADRSRSGDGWNLLVSGSHGQAYRVETAVRTVAELRRRGRDVGLTIAGRFSWASSQSSDRVEVDEWIRACALEDHVHVSGPYTQDDAAALFHDSDILLHTKYNDACPRLVVEAMASGVPVVYSRSGGTPELVGDEAGVGVDAPLDWEKQHPPDPALLANGVETVLDEYEGYRKNAVFRARERFGMETWLDSHASIFRELTELRC